MDSTAASGMGAVKPVLAGAPSASAQRWSLLGRFISSRQPGSLFCLISSPPLSLSLWQHLETALIGSFPARWLYGLYGSEVSVPTG